MKEPYQCWPCNLVKWFGALRKTTPRCPQCHRPMDGPVSKSNCNVCGRELATEAEDEIGLCGMCADRGVRRGPAK